MLSANSSKSNGIPLEGGDFLRDWIKQKRGELGLTQLQVAKAMGVTESYYSYVERGARQMPMDISMAAKLADAFSMTVDEVVALEMNEKEETT